MTKFITREEIAGWLAQLASFECFFHCFENEIRNTIVEGNLFKPGDKVAIGASGGKDSTVLAYIMKLLNERHNYRLNLVLLSIDEGITGYREDSLETGKQNQKDYALPLTNHTKIYMKNKLVMLQFFSGYNADDIAEMPNTHSL
uniref:tRNA(Ile)-lysidine/2-thiocytidine synthase N-terminal domain-containing protein n=1 Tax=Tetranychus urticae TaxID=32264 RepID=T1L0I4_TETUR